jgi:four helix bundle protein
MPFMFENLDVYQKSIDLADKIMELTEQLPKGYGFLSDQLNRAALSVPANIAEGNGRFTKADRSNFFIIARGSLQECVPLLELAYRRELVSDEARQTLRSHIEEIARMLSDLIKGIEKRTN